MEKIARNFDKYLKVYFLVSIIFLSLGFIILYKKVNEISPTPIIPTKETIVKTQGVDACGSECKKEINKAVADAISTISGQTKTVTAQTTTPGTSQKQTVFIPLAGPITTTSTDWVDASGTDFSFDLTSDYNKSATVSWDTFLSVANSNGQAFARLYDVTHKIAVNGSEVSITNTAAPTQVSSGNLSFWAGRNLYRVQIKSLNSFVVTFSSGRVKVTY